jgi:hypothetical protein
VGCARINGETRRNFHWMRSSLITWTLIAAVLIGGLPMLTGVVVTSDSKPAFALDLCHPGGGVSYNLSQTEAPLIPKHTAAQLPQELGAAPEPAAPFFPRVSKALDPPPPKIGA